MSPPLDPPRPRPARAPTLTRPRGAARAAASAVAANASPSAGGPPFAEPAKADGAARPAAAVARPAVDHGPRPAAGPTAAIEAEAAKAPRPARVCDRFTMPESDYVLLGALKKRARTIERRAKKSQVLQAGLRLLASLDDAAFEQAMAEVLAESPRARAARR